LYTIQIVVLEIFCNQDVTSKFVAHHQFSFSAVDQQCGAMPILKRMIELDPSVRFEGATDVVMVADYGINRRAPLETLAAMMRSS